MNLMFLVASKIHFGWHAGDHFLSAAKMTLIFNFISIMQHDIQCPFITAHTTDRDNSFLIAIFMLCMLLNHLKVAHTDLHADIPGQDNN